MNIKKAHGKQVKRSVGAKYQFFGSLFGMRKRSPKLHENLLPKRQGISLLLKIQINVCKIKVTTKVNQLK